MSPRGPTPGSPHRRQRRRWSFPLGRIAGIQVRVHVTFFLLVPLFAVAGSAADGPGVAGALGWLVVIFVCVVLHELGHSVVARRRGVDVHEIDLLPIGGVSRMERLPECGRDEFAIAVAGPLVSLAIAAISALVAISTSVPLTPVDWFGGPIAPRLFWFNLVIVAFNLLPAFPLDGGRVLRSLLERTHDLEDATRIASRVGRRLAIVMGVAGLVVGPVLVVIAVFVYFGAGAEEAATIVHVRLQHRTAGDAMVRTPLTVDASSTVRGARAAIRGSRQRAFPVVGHGRLVGMVTSDDVANGEPDHPVVDLADTTTPALASTDELEARIPLLLESPARALAVVDAGTVVGLVRLEDVEHLVTETTEEGTPTVGW